MMKKAKAYMEEVGASFIVTGEVLGERPMSQRRDSMRLIEKEAGLDGFIVRPLSAKLLPASIPEREGWVDREKLLAFLQSNEFLLRERLKKAAPKDTAMVQKLIRRCEKGMGILAR
jgi:tRNA U34 2-thiouridine synthase MnmA/TrmU